MSALTFATAQLLRVLPRAGLSRLAGELAELPWSPALGRTIVRLYARAYEVDLEECVQREGFRSFDEFFTRALRDGARAVDARAGVVVSPADGRLDCTGAVEPGALFPVKGRNYRGEDLVGDAAEAARYDGGAGCVIYLSPRDYHRVHSPVDGVVTRVRSLPGDYYPVNSIGLRHVDGLFVRNRRVAIAIDTPRESGLGRVTVVMVAALIVGRISVAGIDARDVPFGDHAEDPPRKLARGDELGRFHLGSTVVMFFERGVAHQWLVENGPVRWGQSLCQADGQRLGRRGSA